MEVDSGVLTLGPRLGEVHLKWSLKKSGMGREGRQGERGRGKETGSG